jgi:propionyl-CoA carboxylase alpha chain
MFSKILVANRGEIAVRIMRTCRRMGIASVAIHSDPDARSLHVKRADEVVSIGGATASESYLSKEKVVEAALARGAQAVHPGYGFLSENAEFARMVLDAGLAFVGPPARAIAMMGDKIAAKHLAREAGVPTVPGEQSPIAEIEAARAAAEKIGFPVLLKPAAGGGGKGMRIVTRREEVAQALAACKAEASKAFGDDRVFIERYVARPRHVEIQILADTAGNVVYLGERECSVQRRYQKVIEEAPSVAVDADLRRRMGGAACDLARAAGYVNAGTVEFILDPEGSFYFLEMNTRLQVEHPVTELVTGLDLVELQLRIANGEPLPITQKDVRIRGWAVEARICAEDPDRGFMPSTGSITRYEEPRGRHVRVDSGVEAGSRVSVYYDSMLAKAIAWGESREAACDRLSDALNGYHVEGLWTNIDFANAIVNHPVFREGALSTDFIPQHMEDPANAAPVPTDRLHHMAIATALVYHNRRSLVMESLRPMSPTVGGVRTSARAHRYVVKAGADVFQVDLAKKSETNHWTVSINDRPYEVTTPEFEFHRRRLKLWVDGERKRFLLRYDGNFIRAAHCGIRRTFEIYSPREWELAQFMPEPSEESEIDALICPMPGLVVDVTVQEGDTVYPGQVLVVLESMKMESGVPSLRNAQVREVLVRKGQTVEAGDVLVRF